MEPFTKWEGWLDLFSFYPVDKWIPRQDKNNRTSLQMKWKGWDGSDRCLIRVDLRIKIMNLWACLMGKIKCRFVGFGHWHPHVQRPWACSFLLCLFLWLHYFPGSYRIVSASEVQTSLKRRQTPFPSHRAKVPELSLVSPAWVVCTFPNRVNSLGQKERKLLLAGPKSHAQSWSREGEGYSTEALGVRMRTRRM